MDRVIHMKRRLDVKVDSASLNSFICTVWRAFSISHMPSQLYFSSWICLPVIPSPLQPIPPQLQTPRYPILHLRIHIIILSLVVLDRRRRLLLLQQHLAIQRTGRIELQPRLDALQIEEMVLVAGKADDEGVGVYTEPFISAKMSMFVVVDMTYPPKKDSHKSDSSCRA